MKLYGFLKKKQEGTLRTLNKERGSLRQGIMDLLHRIGRLKGAEIGRIMGVDYSSVSQGRKRLREKLDTDRKLPQLIDEMEGRLSQ
jgi:putative transposase